MKLPLKNASVVALLAVGAALPVGAQGIQYGVKYGGGAVVGAIGPQASRATMNAAFVVDYPLGKTREVFGEFNYRVFRSVDEERTQFGTGYTQAGTTAPIVAASSVDIRKDNLEGYGLSVGYRQQLFDSVFWWQGGLSLNSLTSQQEVTGQIVPGGLAADREGLNFTPAKRSIRPGLFLGTHAKIAPNFFAEVNLTGMSFQWVNYVPYSYTGQPAHVETANKFKLSLDINLGFRF